MKEESSGIMEDEILAEESVPKEKKPDKETQQKPPEAKKTKPFLESLRDWFYKLKSPKPITYVILCALIIILYIGLLLLSSRKNNQPKSTISISQNSTPSPSTSPDPQISAMQEQVDQFSNYINSISSDDHPFNPPNVDLNIKFTGK